MTSRIFAHSRLDGLLVLVAVAQFGTLALGVASFGSVPAAMSLALGIVGVFLMCTNFQCVSHNFIHNPFFKVPRWNRAFGMFNSLLLATPQSMVRVFHFNHHQYNNDLPDPRTGTTGDRSSTWRYGKPPWHEEGFLRYSLLGVFRADMRYLVREVWRKGHGGQWSLELATLLVAVTVAGIVNRWGTAAFLLPVWLLGHIGAQAMNYLEHHGAIPGNRKTDSVSSYGAFYNLIWFNNGYHQEHHFRPQVHWTRLRALRSLLPDESERRVVKGAIWFNFGPVRRHRAPRATDAAMS